MPDKISTQISPSEACFQEAVQSDLTVTPRTDCQAKEVRCVSTSRVTGTVSVRLTPRPPRTNDADNSTH